MRLAALLGLSGALAGRALFATGTPLRIGPLRLKEIERQSLPTDMVALPGPVLGRQAFEAEFRSTIMPDEDRLRDVPPEEAPDAGDPR